MRTSTGTVTVRVTEKLCGYPQFISNELCGCGLAEGHQGEHDPKPIDHLF